LAIQHGEVRGIKLREPFLSLVLVLLAAVGVSVVAGLQGIAGLDVALNQVVGSEAKRLLHITHIRRLFRTEVLVARERQDAPGGPTRDALDRRIRDLRQERDARLRQLQAVGVPGGENELLLIEAAHRSPASASLVGSQAWEKPLADLLERNEQRLADLGRDSESKVMAARRLLLGASAAALVAALGLGGLVLRRVRQAGERLAHGEEQLRRVIDSAPSLLVVLSVERKPTFMSPRAPVFLGRSAGALSEDFFAWVKAEDRPSVEDRFDACLATTHAIDGVNARAVRDDGSEWDARLSLSAVGAQGRQEVLVQILDITAQRKAEAETRTLEAQLRQSQKMESIGLLAGGVAHDFNNLLTAIKGYASLLAEDPGLQASAKESVDGITGAADRAAVLTRKLLSFSRKQVIEPRKVILGDVVTGMEHLLHRILGEDVRLQVRVAAEQQVCMVDASQVEQILLNLAVNARQAMPEGGLLVIETSNVMLGVDYARTHPEVKPGSYVQLMVSDTGVGMPPEVQRRAFEPFFTTKPAGQGTGLGLSVVYGAVRQQGGHVNLYSEPKVGTTFRIYWPALDSQADAVTPTPVHVMRPVSDEVLLLVEDDALVRSFSRRALQAQGYQVVDTESAETALDVAKTLSVAPALLVTDVILPGRHGPALAEALRAQFPDLLVLFCSGYSEQLMSETGHLPAGASLLQKPYDATTLVARVREMLSSRDGANTG
jgi:PAS domain S-box-containing protein